MANKGGGVKISCKGVWYRCTGTVTDSTTTRGEQRFFFVSVHDVAVHNTEQPLNILGKNKIRIIGYAQYEFNVFLLDILRRITRANASAVSIRIRKVLLKSDDNTSKLWDGLW